jgi:MFS family permease
MPAGPVTQESPLALSRSVAQVASGNFLEMYDFTVFGYYATAIAATYFPGRDAFAGLMLTFATFGAGFLMRPIGAVVLGAYTDRHGRRSGLLLTLTLMAVGTLSIAVLPGYAVLGVAAPLLVLCGRLIQGVSAGVELGGVAVYLSEIAPPGLRGFFVSWQSGSQQLAVVFAALVGALLTTHLSKAHMAAYGWRIPFLIGCAIIPFLFVLRGSLKETAAFTARVQHLTLAQSIASLRAHSGIVALGTMLVTMTTVSFYFITAYTPTFGTAVLHLSMLDSLVVTLCVGLSNLLWLPLGGILSDRIGRTPVLVATTLLAAISAYPVLAWMVAAPSFGTLLAAELWLSLLYGIYNGAMVAYLTEIVPESVRTSGFSLAYSLATAIFGGFTPAVATYLIHVTGNRAAPGVWLSSAAILGLAATLLLRARKRERGRV